MDREKVIKGLDICTNPGTKGCIYDMYESAIECPYVHHGCRVQMEKDALALLKEQKEEIENLKQTAQSMMEGACLLKEHEAVKVQYTTMGGFRYGACPQCDARIDNLVNPKACGFCGQELKWE